MRLFHLAGGTGKLAVFHPAAGMLLRAALGHANAACPEALFNATELDAAGIRDPTRGDGRLNNHSVSAPTRPDAAPQRRASLRAHAALPAPHPPPRSLTPISATWPTSRRSFWTG